MQDGIVRGYLDWEAFWLVSPTQAREGYVRRAGQETLSFSARYGFGQQISKRPASDTLIIDISLQMTRAYANIGPQCQKQSYNACSD